MNIWPKELRYAATALFGAGLFGVGLALSPMSQAEPIEPRDRDRIGYELTFDRERDRDELVRRLILEIRETYRVSGRPVPPVEEIEARLAGRLAETSNDDLRKIVAEFRFEREAREARVQMLGDRFEREEREAAERKEREAAERKEREVWRDRDELVRMLILEIRERHRESGGPVLPVGVVEASLAGRLAEASNDELREIVANFRFEREARDRRDRFEREEREAVERKEREAAEREEREAIERMERDRVEREEREAAAREAAEAAERAEREELEGLGAMPAEAEREEREAAEREAEATAEREAEATAERQAEAEAERETEAAAEREAEAERQAEDTERMERDQFERAIESLERAPAEAAER